MRHLPLLIALLIILFSTNIKATTLDDLKAHTPTSDKTWAEQWFYNVAVPNVGYFKISFQTYIAPDFKSPTPKAYIHLAFTPIEGPTTKYDLFLDEVILDHPDGSNRFYYEVPGIIIADENRIDINHDNFKFTLNWNGEHHHYWHGLNPGQTPFGIIPELPGVGSKWFLYTVGTPIEYSFENGNQFLSGTGYAQLDKGWFDEESSSGVIYTMGLSDELYYMFTGATIGNTNIELWAGRYVSQQYDITFHPTLKNLSVKREIDTCAGQLSVEFIQLGKKVVFNANAPIDSFYPIVFPSVIIFGGEQRYMKSMQANIELELYHLGQLKETIQMPQALLEFSGPFACEDVFND